MSYHKPLPLAFAKLYSTPILTSKHSGILWIRRGLNRRYRSRQRLNAKSLALFILSFFASLCIVYHFNDLKHGISKTLQCNQRENHLEENSIELSKRLPQCIIIGVRKGGTRALLEFLNIHPAVEKASDEVHFFDDDSKYFLGLNWYRDQMPYSSKEQITIEKSPAYFITESVPQRIHAMNSSIKLIIIVRDPVTRLISDYAQLAAKEAAIRANSTVKNNKKMPSFEQLVLLDDGRVNVSYKAVRISIYSIYYSRWLRIFPKHQMHIVDGDRLIYEPYSEVQKVEQFLGLSHRINPENFSYNITKGFYCVKINSTIERCLNDSKGRRHPDINPDVVQTLRRFYAYYNKKFYQLTGKDFGWPEI